MSLPLKTRLVVKHIFESGDRQNFPFNLIEVETLLLPAYMDGLCFNPIQLKQRTEQQRADWPGFVVSHTSIRVSTFHFFVPSNRRESSP